MNYEMLYDELFSIGYHLKSTDRVQKWGKLFAVQYSVTTALDVGCAEGRGVRSLLDIGVDAYGCDVSNIAVAKARELTEDHRIVRCSATKTPFNDLAFDGVFCADTLEHLTEEDIRAALIEIFRVTKHYAFLYPFLQAEGKREWLDELHKQGKYPELENLHLTIKPRLWWIDQIRQTGFDIEAENTGWIIAKRVG